MENLIGQILVTNPIKEKPKVIFEGFNLSYQPILTGSFFIRKNQI
jgi:hypothetical protein